MRHSASGIVCSAETCFPLAQVQIEVTATNGGQKSLESDALGKWQIADLNSEEIIRFQKSGYVMKEYRATELPTKIRLLEKQLIGYQSKLWFQPGETIDVFIHSPQKYSARLCRHGETRERVLFLGEFPPQQQQVPDGNFVESGLDWSRSFTYQLPSDARPGLYSLLLRSEGSYDFAIPFVVSTPPSERGKSSKLLVLASTNNWQAYNIWGGRSRYRNLEANDSITYSDFSPGFMRRSVVSTLQYLSPRLYGMLRNVWRKWASKDSPD